MLLKKIVVAEDDDAIAHMVNMALGDAGFLCIRATDGEEAMRIVRMQQPDLLVLDVMMPRADGLEVARKLKADVILSKIPILMLTALADVDSKVKGFEAGADDYLSKPFDLREFAARVKALIRSSRRERDRNPTTDLPGGGAVDQRVAETLASDAKAAVIQFALVGFDEYAGRVGFAKAEELVAALGRSLHSNLCRAGDFLGHLGGVDFLAVVSAQGIEDGLGEIVEAVTVGIAEWTGDADNAGLRLVAGAVETEGVGDESVLAARLATALRDAKAREGSGYVVWRETT